MEGTLYGRLSTDLTSELTHFNPGIRLKQSAFFSTFHVACRRVELLAAMMGHSPFIFVIYAAVSCEKPFHFARETDRYHSNMTRSQDMPSGVVLLSFGYLGEVNPVVHPIREDLIAV